MPRGILQVCTAADLGRAAGIRPEAGFALPNAVSDGFRSANRRKSMTA